MAGEGIKPVKIYRWDNTAKTWIKWDAVLGVGDIQIGAVEIKDATTSTRATVGAQGLHVDPQAATGTNGGDVSVGTSQVEMSFSGTTKSIMIQSKDTNTGSIWVGLTGVTNSGGNAFAQILPGSAVSMDLDDASAAIYAISDTVSQTIYKVALT